MAQEAESDYDSTQLVEINNGKYAIMLRYVGWVTVFVNSVAWSANGWSITS